MKDGERRWKRAGYTWLVRSCEEPKVWQFPITFGYERRTLKIEAARKNQKVLDEPVPDNSMLHFPSGNAQCRIGKLHPKTHKTHMSFVDVVNNAARKRHRPEVLTPVKIDSDAWTESDEEKDQKDMHGLQQQLDAMMKQNSEQQQTIQQLMQQIQNLTTQLQALSAQNLSGGASNSAGNLPNPLVTS